VATFTKISDSGTAAGEASEITIQNLGFACITAVRTNAGNLKLIGWDTKEQIKRMGDTGDQAGAVTEIAMTAANNITYTAVRAGGGQLKVIGWSDKSNPRKIDRLGDSGDQAIATNVSLHAFGTNERACLAVVFRAGDGSLRVANFRLGSPNHSPIFVGDSGTRGGQGDLTAFKEYDTTKPAGAAAAFSTAVRTAAGRLQLISWGVMSQDASEIQRLGDSGPDGEVINQLAMVGKVTAVRTGAGTLKLIHWDVRSGNVIRVSDSAEQAGDIHALSIAQYGNSRYVTAVITTSGGLKLIAWDVDPNGQLVRVGDSGTPRIAATEVAVACWTSSSPQPTNVYTAIRDDVGRLKVINWRMDG
jgi:hypothetical protein